jgi:hypothetical protein
MKDAVSIPPFYSVLVGAATGHATDHDRLFFGSILGFMRGPA